MKINEITNSLKSYVATVKVNGASIRTLISAENSTHARLLLQRMFGSGSVTNLIESSTALDEQGAGTKVLPASELQIKSFADQANKIKQQKKQLQARQALTKAQTQMRMAFSKDD